MHADSHVATDELPTGYQFGNYEILKAIGVGGMARVYRARHRETGSLVALKVMESSLLNSAASRRRFLREGATAATVKHPNVVGMLEVGSWKNLPFIAMELLSGLDLDSYVQKRGPLPESDVVALALPIVAGMCAVHHAGVVHRDIKPSNIFLATGESGLAAPKLLDFGISKIHGSMLETDTRTTGSREIIGTPAYLSPEALNGSRELGPRSDQYSLGVVLYECVVGRSPYAGLTLLQLLQALAAGVVQAPSKVRLDVSKELDAIICRMMATDPSERFDDMGAVGRALWRRAEEPARAIWASQFGVAGYTAPIMGSTSPPVGMTTHGMTLRSLTPVLVQVPGGRRQWRTLGAIAGVGLALMLTAFGVSRYFTSQTVALSSASVNRPQQVLAAALPGLTTRSSPPVATEKLEAEEPPPVAKSVEGRNGADALLLTPTARAENSVQPEAASEKKKTARKKRAPKSETRRQRSAGVTATRRGRKLSAQGSDSSRPKASGSSSDDSDLLKMFSPARNKRATGRRYRKKTRGANGSPILD